VVKLTVCQTNSKQVIKRQQGQALVEFTLVLPLLLLLLFGIVQMSILFRTYLVVNEAAREGARIAAVGGTNEEINKAVRRAINIIGIQDSIVQIDPRRNRTAGASVTVKVMIPVTFTVPFTKNFTPGSLAGAVAMRVELESR
jgi:Flp pilus assembly protein TadG